MILQRRLLNLTITVKQIQLTNLIKILNIIVPCFALLYLQTLAYAQSEGELSDADRAVFRSATSALVALTSDDSLSAGAYDFWSKTGPKIEVELFKLVGEYSLPQIAEGITPIIQISPAVLDLKQNSADGSSGLEIDSTGLGLGAGLRLEYFEDLLEITPRIKFDYAQVDFDGFSDTVESDVIDNLLPDIDTWSYLPSLEFAVKPKLDDHGSRLLLSSKISYLYLRATTSNADVGDFNEESWIWKNRLALEQPLELGQGIVPIVVRPSVARVDMHGSARDGFEFNNIYEFGLDLFTRETANKYFAEIGIGATYIYEDEVKGWRFGLIGKLA